MCYGVFPIADYKFQPRMAFWTATQQAAIHAAQPRHGFLAAAFPDWILFFSLGGATWDEVTPTGPSKKNMLSTEVHANLLFLQRDYC